MITFTEINIDSSDDYDFSNFELWYDDLEEAGITRVIVAYDDGVVGFQTINNDGKTVAIETIESRRGEGIGFLMILESGSYKPERNENPEFWEHVAELYENY